VKAEHEAAGSDEIAASSLHRATPSTIVYDMPGPQANPEPVDGLELPLACAHTGTTKTTLSSTGKARNNLDKGPTRRSSCNMDKSLV
jgi:hypothetical protein